jgi:hypothetical protein
MGCHGFGVFDKAVSSLFWEGEAPAEPRVLL